MGQYVLLIFSLLGPSNPPSIPHSHVCPSLSPQPGFLPTSNPALSEASLRGLRDLPKCLITLGGQSLPHGWLFKAP